MKGFIIFFVYIVLTLIILSSLMRPTSVTSLINAESKKLLQFIMHKQIIIVKPRGKGTVRFAVSAPFVATNQSKYRWE